MSYEHLSLAERKEIEFYHSKRKYSVRKIAEILKRNPSTISREISRNKHAYTNEYSAKKSEHKYYVRRKYCKYQKMKIMTDMKLREYIEQHLKIGWSPEEISGRIASETNLTHVSKWAIYKYIRSVYGRQLEGELGYALIHRKKKYWEKKSKNTLSLENRVFIDKRPEAINERKTYGDWEGDFIVSWKDGSGVLLVLHERKSRFILVRKLSWRIIEETYEAIQSMKQYICNFSSLTLDNDIAFRKHEELSELIKAPIYFCHAYHSWEKGLIENTNRWIRCFVPKRRDIGTVTQEEIDEILSFLNDRPRECIEFRKPTEYYLSLTSVLLEG